MSAHGGRVGTGLRYDRNRRVLSLSLLRSNARGEWQTMEIEMEHDQAVQLYRKLGEILSVEMDG